jgi:AbiV family abortive infection protein
MVLSIEEAVKSIIYRGVADGLVEFSVKGSKTADDVKELDLRRHRIKHDLLARLVLYPVYFDPWLDIFDDVWENKDDVATARKRIDDALSSSDARLARLEPTAERFVSLIGRLDYEKNLGFYVDKVKGRVRTPNDISGVKFESLREFQKKLLHATEPIVLKGFKQNLQRELRDVFKEGFSILTGVD